MENPIEIKLTSLEGELQRMFVVCKKSDITVTLNTVAMALKWRLNP